MSKKKKKPRLIDMVLRLNEASFPLKKIGASPAAPIDPVIDQKQKQMQMEQMIESISRYSQYGTALKRATTMQEVGTQLSQIAELAEQAVMTEADDSYDKHTLQRHIKEMKGYAGSFQKLAQEADMINQRMSALYDDMGLILERYFELGNGADSQQEMPQGRTKTEIPPDVDGSAMSATKDVELKEDALEGELELDPKRPVVEKPTANGNETDHFEEDSSAGGKAIEHDKVDNKVDQLTLRAILSVHNRLKRDNPELAKRFSKLHPTKMQKAVWKLVK
jgi:hypothetical protein